ncbi:hypothetical protein PINS_up001931 [Pythium insidiosum]|nr:hypothetical protein PINS_up001931 [Pythium insidiosum]
MAARRDGATTNGRLNGDDGAAKRKWSAVEPHEVEQSLQPAFSWADDEQGRRKWTRMLLRELYDLGFEQSAASLEREAGVRLRSPAMEQLERLIQGQRWDEAIMFVQRAGAGVLAATTDDRDNNDAAAGGDATMKDEKDEEPSNGVDKELVIRMRSTSATRAVMLLLLKRKFVGQLLARELPAALRTFQDEIMPNHSLSEEEVQELAILLLCNDDDEMKKLVTMPIEPSELLRRIESLVSADDVVPPGALRRVVCWDNCDHVVPRSLKNASRVSARCMALLLKHSQDVMDLQFSPEGNYLASVSRDGDIVIWETVVESNEVRMNPASWTMQPKVLHVLHSIDGAPDCIDWSPDGQCLLSCGGENNNIIQLWNPLTGRRGRRFQHPAETVTTVKWHPSGKQFLSGSIEKSLVLWNVEDSAITYQWTGRRILDIAVHLDGSRVYALTGTNEIRVYSLLDKSDECFYRSDTSLSCVVSSPRFRISTSRSDSIADSVLINSFATKELLCLDAENMTIISRCSGFKQKRYIVRPCFAGTSNELIVGGSEDGTVHVWRQQDGRQMCKAQLHSSVVNAVVVHPKIPHIIASASDDETIRIWHLEAE